MRITLTSAEFKASPLVKASQLVKGPQESTIAYAANASPLPLESGNLVVKTHPRSVI